MQVSLLFQRATTHGLQSRRRSWKNAQEIIKTTCPTVVPTTVHGAVQRLTARHGGEGDGKGEGEDARARARARARTARARAVAAMATVGAAAARARARRVAASTDKE